MTEIKRIGDLEIDQDEAFERRTWTVQRFAWAVMALSIAAALLGLLGGSGPLTTTRIGSLEEGLEVTYSRIDRAGGTPILDVRIAPELARNGVVRLSLADELIDALQMERIEPEPESVELTGSDLVMVFAAAQPTAPLTVRFHPRPNKPGATAGRIGVEGGPTLDVPLYIFP